MKRQPIKKSKMQRIIENGSKKTKKINNAKPMRGGRRI